VIETSAAPAHTGPVPQAVEAGGWIYVSASFGADPTTHAIPADARDEAEQLFANLAAILAAAGARLTDVVRVGIVMRAWLRPGCGPGFPTGARRPTGREREVCRD
jgi:2-iminobutanoate/2-iminopropanoate deaminase